MPCHHQHSEEHTQRHADTAACLGTGARCMLSLQWVLELADTGDFHDGNIAQAVL